MQASSRPGRRLRRAVMAGVLAALVVPLFFAAHAHAWSPRYQTVDFVNSSRGWAAGLDGTIVRTTNGGRSWTVQRKVAPGAPSLHDISFYDGSRGVAVGQKARIFRTTNGGKTWTRIYSIAIPATYDLYAVKMATASKGWAVGGIWSNSYLDTETPEGAVFKTTNGGRTWVTDTLISGACPTALDMKGTTLGVVAGRSRVQSDPSTGYDVPFVMTWDGLAWSLPAYPSLTTVTSSVADADIFASGSLVVVGEYGDTEPFTPFLLQSPFLGTSWSESNPASGPVRPQEVKMTSATTGYCVGFGQQAVYKTTDGGVTWSDKSTRYGTYLMGCDFVTSSTGYAVGAYGAAHTPLIVKTTNGARTWTRVK